MNPVFDPKRYKPGIYYIVGTNGSGKTTTLRSLAKSLATEGNVVYCNIEDRLDINSDNLNDPNIEILELGLNRIYLDKLLEDILNHNQSIRYLLIDGDNWIEPNEIRNSEESLKSKGISLILTKNLIDLTHGDLIRCQIDFDCVEAIIACKKHNGMMLTGYLLHSMDWMPVAHQAHRI